MAIAALPGLRQTPVSTPAVFLAAFCLSLAIALARGGNLFRLSALPLRWPLVPILAFAPQLIVVYMPESIARLASTHTAILILSYLALVAFLCLNYRLPGMRWIALGLLLNLAAMVANGGYMPITPQALERIGHESHVVAVQDGSRVAYSKDVLLTREQTHLWLLTDILVFPDPFPIPSAASVGDSCIALGGFVLIQQALLGRVRGGSAPAPGPKKHRQGAGKDQAGEQKSQGEREIPLFSSFSRLLSARDKGGNHVCR